MTNLSHPHLESATPDGDALNADHNVFMKDTLEGLSSPQKTIPSKYLYDEKGSQIFEQICQLDCYYPTRVEMALLHRHAGDMAQRLGPRGVVIEYGAGALDKIRILLDHLETPAAFIPIDISGDHLKDSASQLASDYPEVPIKPVCSDFMHPFDLEGALDDDVLQTRPRLGFFPGSTIGNFSPAEASRFLTARAQELQDDNMMVVGFDLKKSPDIISRAYNDPQGVTASFNLNLLDRINRELNADFDRQSFHHEARYKTEQGRVEMHLVSQRTQTVHVNGQEFDFATGESIHTENSYKYHPDEFVDLVNESGFSVENIWHDEANLFALGDLTVDSAALAKSA